MPWLVQGGAAEAAGYKPSEESLQRFWEHCEAILSREAVEVPEASLDADTQAQRLAHAKLEQVHCSHLSWLHSTVQCFCSGRSIPSSYTICVLTLVTCPL